MNWHQSGYLSDFISLVKQYTGASVEGIQPIVGLTMDTRQAGSGYCLILVPGTRFDARDYISQSTKAALILYEADGITSDQQQALMQCQCMLSSEATITQDQYASVTFMVAQRKSVMSLE